jgi:PAS domain S-box-containing protein
MGERIRGFAWDETPLGPREDWPQSLKTALGLILDAQMPMWLGWGAELYFFYNDAYGQVLGPAKHPWALGRPAAEVWREIWHICGPLAERVLARGEAPFVENVRLFVDRGDLLEEVFFSFSYSPIRGESGQVSGLFCPNTEVTAKQLNARRIHTLSELSAKAYFEKTTLAACASAAATIAKNADDIPFSLIYLVDDDATSLYLAQATRVDSADATVAPERVTLADGAVAWPLVEVLERRQPEITAITSYAARLPRGLADQALRQAMTLPLIASDGRALGVIVVGASPALRLDGEYVTFFELLAGQIATALQNAGAAESARAGDEARVTGLKAGADDYLVKPFSARELIVRVSTHFALAKARAEAQRSHDDLYAMFMQVPAAITVRRGDDLRCVFQNAASLAIVDQRGRTLEEQWPEHAARWRVPYERALRDGESVSLVEIAARHDWSSGGRATRYWDVTYAPLRRIDGTIEGVVSMSFEVTDRVRARQLAEESEARRQIAFAAAQVGTWRMDLVTQQVTRDASMSRILGIADAESGGTLEDYLHRVHPDDRVRVTAAVHAAVQHGTDYLVEHRVVRPEGTLRWVRDAGRVVRDEHGASIALTGAAVDVTELKLAEERARAAQERLRAALDASAIGTYTWDIRANRVDHDAGVKRLFGFAAEEGTPLDAYTQRIHPDDRQRWLDGLAASEREGVDFAQEYRVVHSDGSEHWLLDKGRATHDGQGRAVYMVGAVVDITEPKRLAEEAMAASRAKDEFLAMLGHELRNPLAPITTALALIAMRGNLEDKAYQVIDRQVRHLARLVDDLLDISRVTRGLIELVRARIRLRDVVDKALEMASPLVEVRHHIVTIDVPDNLWIDADPTRMAQVFANLLTNAARYTPARGKIAIHAEHRGEHVHVTVRDNGIGIPRELQPRIFELFVQGAPQTAARAAGGLGIGLALVRSLVQLHDGDVTVSSPGENLGSEFTVRLPVAASPAVGRFEPTAAMPIASTAGLRVLLVDDNVDAAELLGDLLRHFGHTVSIAHDGPSALQEMKQFRPDAAVLDIGLPVMDGYELAGRLRTSEFQPRILVALTGYGQEHDRRRSVEAGFDAHLVKPVDVQRLIALLVGA